MDSTVHCTDNSWLKMTKKLFCLPHFPTCSLHSDVSFTKSYATFKNHYLKKNASGESWMDCYSWVWFEIRIGKLKGWLLFDLHENEFEDGYSLVCLRITCVKLLKEDPQWRHMSARKWEKCANISICRLYVAGLSICIQLKYFFASNLSWDTQWHRSQPFFFSGCFLKCWFLTC